MRHPSIYTMSLNVSAIKKYVSAHYPFLGVNKTKEIIRLVYEIAKRDGCDYKLILKAAAPADLNQAQTFLHLKRNLLRRRFPSLTDNELKQNIIFPELKIQSSDRVRLRPSLTIQPQKIFVEESVRDSALAQRVKRHFPKAQWRIISLYKDYVRQKMFTTQDYNKRADLFFIVKEQYDFFLPCPCSPDSLGCGYQILNLGMGCPYECVYCYFQGYVNAPGLIFPANIEDYLSRFDEDKYPRRIRLGTGQFTDSLVLDHVTRYSSVLIDFFKRRPLTQFEFKTKSANVRSLIQQKGADNIIISWTLNPPRIVREVEYYTATLAQRLKAAARCAQAGYRVGFHFDPIIYYPGWDKDYKKLVTRLFDRIPAERIAWISLGLLRLTPKVKQTIEARFPSTKILDGELIPGYDGKLRYPFRVRQRVFDQMRAWIRARGPKVPLYLCMEEKGLADACRIYPKFV